MKSRTVGRNVESKKISIIIPVYNEIKTLEKIIEKVENADLCSLEKEIILFGVGLTDMETCYKAFRADVIRNLSIKSNRFDFEPEVILK